MRALLFETRTGKPIIDLEVTDWSYDTGILAADSLKVSVPAYTPRSEALNLRELLTPRKHAIALVDDSVTGAIVVPAAGYIASVQADEDSDGLNTYSVACQGFEKLLEKRHVRKYPGWPLTTVLGKPVTTFDVNYSGLEYGTIMKKLVQEALKFPGGELPIVFEPDRSGNKARNYLALDGKPVLEAVDDLTELVGGVEYDLQPKINNLDQVSLLFATGTDAKRIVTGAASPVFNIGGAYPDIAGWEREPAAQDMCTAAIFTGGKGSTSGDKVLAARALSSAYTDAGYPYSEVWDSSHTSVSHQATLQAWADGRLAGLTELISFKVRFERARTLRHGDRVLIDALGHWDMPDGRYPRRVLSVSRSSSSPDWLAVKLVGAEL